MIKVKAVLFDFYDTLVYGENWEDFWKKALERTVEYLNSLGLKVSVETFSEKFEEIRAELLRDLERTKGELDIVYLFWKLLKEFGHTPAITLLQRVIDLFYSIEVCSVKLYPDAIPTVEHFRRRGFKTAIVSNATARFEYVVKKYCLYRYFDILMASYKVMRPKPHPAIFSETLRLLGVKPKEAVMVGDSYKADIAGAKRLGIRGILLNRSGSQGNIVYEKGLEPDAVIHSLNELIDLIELL